MSDFDLVIFDCDGTLVRSDDVLNGAFIDVIKSDGIIGYQDKTGFVPYDLHHANAHWLGSNLPTIIRGVEHQTGVKLSADIPARLSARYAELVKTELKEIEGAVDAVNRISYAYKICVATNGQRKDALNALDCIGLLRVFTEACIFYRELVANPKPAPDLLLHAANIFNVAASRCLVIEDSATGVRAAVAAGMTVYGLTTASPRPEERAISLYEAGAAKVFPRFSHIAADLVP